MLIRVWGEASPITHAAFQPFCMGRRCDTNHPNGNHNIQTWKM